MTICPFISTNTGVTRCHPNCALRIDDECAIKVLAAAKLPEQKAKNSEKQPNHK